MEESFGKIQGVNGKYREDIENDSDKIHHIIKCILIKLAILKSSKSNDPQEVKSE